MILQPLNPFCRWWSRYLPNVIALLLTAMFTSTAYLAFLDTNNPRVLESETRDAHGKAKTQYRAGEMLYVYRKFCVDRVSVGDVDIEIVSKTTGSFWYLGTRSAGARKGCSARTSANQLPDDLPPDVYLFRAQVQYTVNPLRTFTFLLPELEFEVVK